MPAVVGHGAAWLKAIANPEIDKHDPSTSTQNRCQPTHNDRGTPNLPDPTDAAMRHSSHANIKHP